MVRAISAIVLLLACEPAGASPTFQTGNQIYATCPSQAGDHVGKALLGLGYTLAIADEAASSPIKFACVPNNATAGQVHGVTCRWLENHPEARHLEANLLVKYALKEAWPCRKQ